MMLQKQWLKDLTVLGAVHITNSGHRLRSHGLHCNNADPGRTPRHFVLISFNASVNPLSFKEKI